MATVVDMEVIVPIKEDKNVPWRTEVSLELFLSEALRYGHIELGKHLLRKRVRTVSLENFSDLVEDVIERVAEHDNVAMFTEFTDIRLWGLHVVDPDNPRKDDLRYGVKGDTWTMATVNYAITYTTRHGKVNLMRHFWDAHPDHRTTDLWIKTGRAQQELNKVLWSCSAKAVEFVLSKIPPGRRPSYDDMVFRALPTVCLPVLQYLSNQAHLAGRYIRWDAPRIRRIRASLATGDVLFLGDQMPCVSPEQKRECLAFLDTVMGKAVNIE